MILKRAEELGRLVGQSEEYQALKRANERLMADDGAARPSWSSCARCRWASTRSSSGARSRRPEPQTEMDALLGVVQASPIYQGFVAAQANFDKLMTQLNEQMLEGIRLGGREPDHHARRRGERPVSCRDGPVPTGRRSPPGACSSPSRASKGPARRRRWRCWPSGCAARGARSLVVREPGGTPLAEEARRLVLDPALDLGAAAELFLMLVARADLVHHVVRPALARGTTVLADRFDLSTRAYQIGGRGLPEPDVVAANRIATGGLAPDLVVVLDVAPDVGRADRDPLGELPVEPELDPDLRGSATGP